MSIVSNGLSLQGASRFTTKKCYRNANGHIQLKGLGVSEKFVFPGDPQQLRPNMSLVTNFVVDHEKRMINVFTFSILGHTLPLATT